MQVESKVITFITLSVYEREGYTSESLCHSAVQHMIKKKLTSFFVDFQPYIG